MLHRSLTTGRALIRLLSKRLATSRTEASGLTVITFMTMMSLAFMSAISPAHLAPLELSIAGASRGADELVARQRVRFAFFTCLSCACDAQPNIK